MIWSVIGITALARMGAYPIRIGLLSRYRSAKEQKETLRGLRDGTVDIVAVGLDGKAPAQSVIAEAQTIVDTERPVGADAKVLAATETAVNVTAAVTLMDGGDLEAVKTAFDRTLADFFRDTALRTNIVSHGKVLRLLLDCEGVADVSGFTMNGSGDSLTLAEAAVPVAGTVTLTEVSA